jgi:hypothetical protein
MRSKRVETFTVKGKPVFIPHTEQGPGLAKTKPKGLAGDSAARKEAPIYEGFMCYFPNAIAEVARLSLTGNEKHNPGQPLHWSFTPSNDLEFLHAVMVAWRAMAQLETLLLKKHPELKPGKNVRGFAR